MPVRRGRKGKQGGKQGSGKQATVTARSLKHPTESDASASATASGGTGTDNLSRSSLSSLELIWTSDKRRGVYECDYCGADISQAPRIRCAVCDDFDVCCDCFATTDPATALSYLRAAHAVHVSSTTTATTGVSSSTTATASKEHDPFTHGYRVCDSTRFPLFPVRSGGVKPVPIVGTVANKNKVKSSIATSTSLSVVVDSNEGTEENEFQDDDDLVDTPEKDKNGDSPPSTKTSETASDATAMASGAAAAVATVIMPAGEDAKTIWTVEEDVRLLQGIQAHGLGNWTDISEAVAGQGSQGKTPKRCMERYFDDYMGRYGHILPPYTLISESIEEDDTPVDDETAPNNEDDVGGEGAASVTTTVLDATATSTISNTTTPAKETDSSASKAAATDMAPNTSTGEATRSSKRRAAMLRSPTNISNSSGPVKKYKAVLTETLPEYQKVRPVPYLPILDSGPVQVGQEVGRDQIMRAEQAYVRAISSMDSTEGVERIRKEWELNRLNQPGGPTVLPMRPDDIPTLPGSELAGFMPRRGDFDVEWENNAEEAIADMEFIPGESEQDRQIKLQVLAIYNSKLDEREKRKTFVLSRKLFDYRQYQQEYQKLPTDERDLVHRMRLFERFHTPAEHKIFIDDLLKAKRLRKEIARLQMYRRMGIRTLVEAERFELDKARRLFHRDACLQKEAEAKKAEGSGGIAVLETRAGGAIVDDSESSLYWKQYRTTDRKVRRSVNRGSSIMEEEKVEPSSELPSTEPLATAMDAKATATDAKASGSDPTPMEIDTVKEESPLKEECTLEGEKSSKEESSSSETSAPLENVSSMDIERNSETAASVEADLTSLPGYNKLSAREVDLCRSISLEPAQYLVIKKALIYESLTQGLLETKTKAAASQKAPPRSSGGTGGRLGRRPSGPSSAPQTLVKIDIERRGAIIDFVVRAGWISTQFGKTVRDNNGNGSTL
jgi:Myb-like DNA-binding domain/Zinc finger, ZZ type